MGKASAEGDLAVTSKDFKGDIQQLAGLHRDYITKAENVEGAVVTFGVSDV